MCEKCIAKLLGSVRIAKMADAILEKIGDDFPELSMSRNNFIELVENSPEIIKRWVALTPVLLSEYDSEEDDYLEKIARLEKDNATLHERLNETIEELNECQKLQEKISG